MVGIRNELLWDEIGNYTRTSYDSFSTSCLPLITPGAICQIARNISDLDKDNEIKLFKNKNYLKIQNL